ncbi:MAG: hypothetical protein IJX76_10290 [Clostridia bacterium]|nr:hypothetical protein [Clostridia bacterium]
MLDSSWGFTTLEIALDISRLSKDLYLRYSVSGSKEDTWRNRNVIVSAVPNR